MRIRWWFNAPVLWLLRSPLHRLLSRSVLAISVRGRASGRTYTLPVNYLQQGFTLLIISPQDRTWWRNLQEKAPVTLRLRGREVHATAQAITDPAEVMKGLLVLLRRSPRYQRSLGVPLDRRGYARQQVRLAQVASEYALIRVSLLAVTEPGLVAEEPPAVFSGGRSQ